MNTLGLTSFRPSAPLVSRQNSEPPHPLGASQRLEPSAPGEEFVPSLSLSAQALLGKAGMSERELELSVAWPLATSSEVAESFLRAGERFGKLSSQDGLSDDLNPEPGQVHRFVPDGGPWGMREHEVFGQFSGNLRQGVMEHQAIYPANAQSAGKISHQVQQVGNGRVEFVELELPSGDRPGVLRQTVADLSHPETSHNAFWIVR